ncbi:MAG: purine-nucleoside phosphorylase [Candidatus Omnitrophica bacterium]|nr:purine-nucleoside phosphorylase [Candidatus Omnitrophota bacterium]
MLEATSSPLHAALQDTVQAIQARSRLRPSIALVLGSGLGGLTKSIQVETEIEYADVPHVSKATAPGHEGKFVLGTIGTPRVVVLSGRFHFYEGHGPAQISYPVRVVHAMGAKILILTSIVGSMNRAMPPGSLVMLEDHINLMGMNPLIGPNDEAVGPRFPDMSEPYDPGLRRLAKQVASEQGIPLHEGVYVAVAGPNLETRAEYRFLRQIGADVVGMSVVPEVITARHAGLRVLAVTVVSDACIPEELKPASLEELLRVAGEAEPKLTTLLKGVIARL